MLLMTMTTLPLNKIPNTTIFVGNKPLMNYVQACVMQLNDYKETTIVSRGKFCNKALDTSQIVIKKIFSDKTKISEIIIDSEKFRNHENKEITVTTLLIKIVMISQSI